jgi:WD40 repeat protein
LTKTNGGHCALVGHAVSVDHQRGDVVADGGVGAGRTKRTRTGARRYSAFVSYSHADDEIASWLHRRLENYRIPAALAPGGRRKLGKLFRDRVELSAAHDLGGEIRKALDVSDALILLCSPRSARSQYVAEEIRYFKQRGVADRIFAVIVDGEPHAAGKPGRTAEEECFPRALLYRVDEYGILTDTPEANEPIAADVREGRDGRESGVLKLIAGLLGVGLDELVQREKQAERARRRRIQLVAAGFAILAAGAAVAGGVAVWQRGEAVRNREIADAKTIEAEKNERRAIKGEDEAKANFAEAERQRIEAERNATQREIQRDLAAVNAAKATSNAEQARNTLRRFFATRGWEKIEDGDLRSAAMYALAGARLSPPNLTEYEAVLAHVMHVTPDPQFSALHGAEIQDLAFRGSRVISTGRDGIVRIWRAGDGREQGAFGDGASITRTVISRDGTHILTLKAASPARISDGFTGRTLHTLAHTGHDIMSADLSWDGLHVVTAGKRGDVIIWKEGKPLHVLQDVAGAPDRVAFAPDGARFVTAGGASTPQIWDTGSGARLFTLDAQAAKVLSLAFTTDNEMLVTASDDNVVRLWKIATGKLALARPDQRGLRSATPSPNWDSIATVNAGGTIRLWKLDDPEFIWQASGCMSPDLEFSRDARWLRCGGRVLEAATGRPGPRLPGNVAAFSVLSDRVATGGVNGIVEVFPLSVRQTASVDLPGESLGKGTFSADGQGVLLAQSTGKVSVWNLALRSNYSLGDHGAAVSSANFSLDGKFAVTTGGREARIWEADRRRLVANLPHQSGVIYAAFSPDSRRVATTSYDGAVRLWKVSEGSLQLKVQHPVNGVHGVAFSPTAELFATAGADGHIRLWDFSGRQVRSVATPGALSSSVVFTPDGARLVAAMNGDVRVWSVATGELVLSIAAEHDVVSSVAISAAGHRILSAHLDGTLHVWDSKDGHLIASMDSHDSNLANAVFSADDARMLTSSRSGTARIWDVGRLTQPFHGGLALSACNQLRDDRAFIQAEIDADPLLRSEWAAGRDVCEGIPGIAPLKPN